jgi:hypothetical protein
VFILNTLETQNIKVIKKKQVNVKQLSKTYRLIQGYRNSEGGCGLIAYIKEKNEIFFRELLYPRHFRIITIIYITLKITEKLFFGESYLAGLKSGAVGILTYFLAMYAINLASTSKNGHLNKELLRIRAERGAGKQQLVIARRGLFVAFGYSLFLLLIVFDNLQRRNLIIGNPIMSYVPGYDSFILLLQGLSQNVTELANFIIKYQILNIIVLCIFYILIPYLIFRLLGYSFKGLFSLRHSIPALLILALSIVLFINRGLKGNWAWNLIYAILISCTRRSFFS